jgi:histidinol-phosphate aminotransferase
MTLKTKQQILNIQPYVPGKSGAKGVKVAKLSSNENPLGCSAKVLAAIADIKDFSRYPDGSCTALREKIGAMHGFNPNNIICGAGSDEVLELVTYAFCQEGDEVIYTEHGFLVYPIAAMSAGAVPVKVAEKNYTTDVDAILAAVTAKTRVVFVANPNNPTGTYISAAEMARLHAGLRADILLVIDNAYAECVTAKDWNDGRDLALVADNVLLTRTFSKMYGIPALRLGWGFGSDFVIDILNRIRPPFNVNSIAQIAGIAALDDQEFIAKSVEHNTKWREWLTQQLAGLGLEVVPSQGNFLLVKFADAVATFEKLRSNNIIVREMGAYGLPEFLRISIGTEAEMRDLVSVLAQ